MASEDVNAYECEFTRSGINRYDILKSYKMGNPISLVDIVDTEEEIEILQKKASQVSLY